MTLSFRAGRPIDTDAAATYADGIASRIAIPRAVELMPGRVDEMRLVSEDALHDAQAELTEELGITVEGAAAASWAGLLGGRAARRPGRRHRHRQQRLSPRGRRAQRGSPLTRLPSTPTTSELEYP